MGSDDPRDQIAHRGPAFVDRVATTNAAQALGTHIGQSVR